MTVGDPGDAQALIRQLLSERDALIEAAKTAVREIGRAEEARRVAEARLVEQAHAPSGRQEDAAALRARVGELEAENRRLRTLLAEHGRAARPPSHRPVIDPFVSLDPGEPGAGEIES